MHLAGMPAMFTVTAAEIRRRFPASKNRSRRIHKKLVKRHGGEFFAEPIAFALGGVLYVHPALRESILKAIPRAAPAQERATGLPDMLKY